MRLNVTECINTNFEKSKRNFISFSEILFMCTGDDYNMILRFYK